MSRPPYVPLKITVREWSGDFLPCDGEILEAGSGLGFWLAFLAEAGHRVRRMDYSQEALEQARRTFPELRFDRGDVRELPYPS